jgi:hypothetical protein
MDLLKEMWYNNVIELVLKSLGLALIGKFLLQKYNDSKPATKKTIIAISIVGIALVGFLFYTSNKETINQLITI